LIPALGPWGVCVLPSEPQHSQEGWSWGGVGVFLQAGHAHSHVV
jgi:hypothetical protein